MKRYSIYIQKKSPIIIYADNHQFSHDNNTLILTDGDSPVGIFNWANIGGFEIVDLPKFIENEELI